MKVTSQVHCLENNGYTTGKMCICSIFVLLGEKVSEAAQNYWSGEEHTFDDNSAILKQKCFHLKNKSSTTNRQEEDNLFFQFYGSSDNRFTTTREEDPKS